MITDSFAGSSVRHGTPSGFTKHQRLGEAPCPACWDAKSEYDNEWRSAPERTRKNRLTAAAQTRALRRLKDMHPSLYAALYAEAKREIASERGDAA